MWFLIAHLCKNIIVGWLHLLQQKYISWCLITDMRLPWKPNSTISLIQAKFQESNCLQFSLFFCFSLLVKMTNRRWHQEQRHLPCCCPWSLWPNKGHSWCWSDDVSAFCFFLGKRRDRDKERQVLALLRVIQEPKRASAPMFIFVVFRDVRMKTNKFIIPDDRGVRELSSDL